MKRVLIVSACFFFLFATLQYGQTLQNEKLLYHAPEGVRWTQCAFGPDGVLWVIWAPGTTNDDSGGAVWVLSYDGITVSEPLRLTAAATRASTHDGLCRTASRNASRARLGFPSAI